MDLKELEILGDQVGEHWYYSSKAHALKTLLGTKRFRSIADIGAGSGFFSRFLLEQNLAQSAICVDNSYPEESNQIYHGKSIQFKKHISSSQADLVLLMDVLEHVNDDLGLLKEYVALAPNLATFVITVPAFNFMWSGHDEFLGHKRRYTLQEINDLCKKCGLKVETSCYYFGLIFPIAFLSRYIEKRLLHSNPRSQLKQHNPFINFILKKICEVELLFIKANRILGLSVFAVARKD